MAPDKVIFTKNKDGTYRIEVTCNYPNKTTVMDNCKCEVKWKDSDIGIPEEVSFLSDLCSYSEYYKTTK